MKRQIEQAVHLIRKANNIVAMSGAGISTPSGIPDFRSADSGLWEQVDPMAVASIFAFQQNPQQFYKWIRPLARTLFEARPNPAHYALVALEEQGKLKAVITQNIDNLHQKAGTKTIYELHGHLREVTCLECHQVKDATPIMEKLIQDGEIPRHDCGGIFKPNVIFFGESLPVREYVAAQEATRQADLMLVTGSSLEVAPASDLPALALRSGAGLIIINHQPTYLDDRADVVIQAELAEILPRLVELL